MTREELKDKIYSILWDKFTPNRLGKWEIDNAVDEIAELFPLPPAEGAEGKKTCVLCTKPAMDNGLCFEHNVCNVPKQPQPTAEGAEEILTKHLGSLMPLKYGVKYNKTIDAMREFAALHAQRIADKMVKKNWININDRMPESGFCVLLYSESGGVAEGAWSDSNGYFEQWRWSAVLSDVTHWMPLPNPPIE